MNAMGWNREEVEGGRRKNVLSRSILTKKLLDVLLLKRKNAEDKEKWNDLQKELVMTGPKGDFYSLENSSIDNEKMLWIFILLKDMVDKNDREKIIGTLQESTFLSNKKNMEEVCNEFVDDIRKVIREKEINYDEYDKKPEKILCIKKICVKEIRNINEKKRGNMETILNNNDKFETIFPKVPS